MPNTPGTIPTPWANKNSSNFEWFGAFLHAATIAIDIKAKRDLVSNADSALNGYI